MSKLPKAPSTPVELFLALVQIDSPSRHEGKLASEICRWLDEINVAYSVDNAAKITGSDTGNIIARTPYKPDRPTVLFVSHLDTVQPVGTSIIPVVGKDNVIRSQGDTILGADNKASVAAVLSVLARPKEDHANLIAVFSTSEESGVMGIKQIVELKNEIDYAFPIDGSPAGVVYEAALGHAPFQIHIKGKASHAAMQFDQGVHAIKVASEIVSKIDLGWQEDTVINVGQIQGGGATNIVPAEATIVGEVRSFSDQAIQSKLTEIKNTAEQMSQQSDATSNLVVADNVVPAFIEADPKCLAIAEAAANQAGIPFVRERLKATLEGNHIYAMGIPMLAIASGGQNPHSTHESIGLQELEDATRLLDSILLQAKL